MLKPRVAYGGAVEEEKKGWRRCHDKGSSRAVIVVMKLCPNDCDDGYRREKSREEDGDGD